MQMSRKLRCLRSEPSVVSALVAALPRAMPASTATRSVIRPAIALSQRRRDASLEAPSEEAEVEDLKETLSMVIKPEVGTKIQVQVGRQLVAIHRSSTLQLGVATLNRNL